MPHLKVLARARPGDKYMLVAGLKQMGCTVAATGDATNDAPAMKEADVSFSMAQNSTEICDQAADILITDNNFLGIVYSCM